MVRPLRVASAFLIGGLLSAQAKAQAPASAVQQPKQAAKPANTSMFAPIPTDPSHPDYHPGAHRTILRHNPLPRRTSYNSYYSQGGQTLGGGQSAGYANPGGVGRYAEYYDQNTLAPPVDYHANPVAKFDSGGGPDRSEQMQAQQLGLQRARNIQNHIDTYGRPIGFGFGYGLGLSGGRGYAFPY